jgi:C_GCAxxG_C_C family probable redox protein
VTLVLGGHPYYEYTEDRVMKDVKEGKTEIIQRAFSLGFEYEKTIRGCCQCTIAAIQDALEIRNDDVFQAGSGLTAGGGISCEGSCGGYTGGVMVMSSVFGRRREKWDNDRGEKDCAHNMARALLDKFNLNYGGNVCKIIHRRLFGREFNLKDARDREAFEGLGAHVDKCTSVVGTAAAWATELILEELSNRGMFLNDIRKIK